MIQITRQLARQVRSAWRRLAPRASGGVVELKASEKDLVIRLHRCDILAEFAVEGQFVNESIAMPFAALADIEGRDTTTVSITQDEGFQVHIQWTDKDLPCSKSYDGMDPENLPTWPKRAVKTATNDKLLDALLRASASTAKTNVRYILTHLQLRGEAGEVVATDGTQLFIEAGFKFPWKDNVLVPNVMGLRHAPLESAEIGRVDEHITLSNGAWSFWLPIAKEGRYPQYEHVLPKDKQQGELEIVAQDAEFAAQALLKLPGADDDNSPVTMDLNGEVIIRAAASEKSKPTELVLSGSRYQGTPLRFQVNRHILKRAFELGCTKISLSGTDHPLLGIKDNQRFIFMSLGKARALAPNDSCVRVLSQKVPSKPQPRKQAVTPNKTEETAQIEERVRKVPASLSALIAETKSLCEEARSNCRRASQILAGLKKHSKKTRLMQSTLKSLHQLQKIGD